MARNTQMQLAEAIKRLMLKKPLDAITVQELADEANVNKKTFYYHYRGISDLLIWMYSDWFYSMIDTLDVTAENWQEELARCTLLIRTDHIYITAIYDSRYLPEVRYAMEKMFNRALEKYVRTSFEHYRQQTGSTLELTPTQFRYLVSYHSTALFGLLEQWMLNGMQESNEAFVELIDILANDSMQNAFARMDK